MPLHVWLPLYIFRCNLQALETFFVLALSQGFEKRTKARFCYPHPNLAVNIVLNNNTISTANIVLNNNTKNKTCPCTFKSWVFDDCFGDVISIKASKNYPTCIFITSEPQDQEISVLQEVQETRTTDFEAQRLQKGRSGCIVAKWLRASGSKVKIRRWRWSIRFFLFFSEH